MSNATQVVENSERRFRNDRPAAVDPAPGPKFSPDQVVTAIYEAVFGLPPDPTALQLNAASLTDGDSIRDMLRAKLGSREYMFLTHKLVHLGPLDRGAGNDVQIDLTPAEQQRLWDNVRRVWSQFGEQDPYWSVASAERYRSQNMDRERIDAFYASGENDVGRAEAYLGRHGRTFQSDGVCVDYGCGLGRVTLWLAKRFKRVIAADISESHLRIARENLTERGVTNVDYVHIRSQEDLLQLQGFDMFHSIIVLQHSPPPIMWEILKNAFRGLNPGGLAYFQVPTYGLNYTWSLDSYLHDKDGKQDFEMNVLPQEAVFQAAAEAGCVPLEVQPDACTGIPYWISNTFLIEKSK